jgi:hypothetical protein
MVYYKLYDLSVVHILFNSVYTFSQIKWATFFVCQYMTFCHYEFICNTVMLQKLYTPLRFRGMFHMTLLKVTVWFMHSCILSHLTGRCKWSLWNKVCSDRGQGDKSCYHKEEGYLYLYLQIQTSFYTSDYAISLQTGKGKKKIIWDKSGLLGIEFAE